MAEKDPFGNRAQNDLAALEAISSITQANQEMEEKGIGSEDGLEAMVQKEQARLLLEPYREDM